MAACVITKRGAAECSVVAAGVVRKRGGTDGRVEAAIEAVVNGK